MKKNLYKILAFVSAAAIVSSACPVFADSPVFESVVSEYSENVRTLKYNGIVYNYVKEPGFVSLGQVVVGNNTDTELSDINIPAAITVEGKTYEVIGISNNAFSLNENITNIKIGRSVQTIGEKAFNLCSNLKNIEVDNKNLKFSSSDGVLFDYKKTKLIKYPDLKSDESYSVGKTVSEIVDCAFYNNKYLKRVDLGDGVLKIGNYAFANCKSVESISFGNYLESVGDYAFYKIPLKNVSLPRTVTSIGKAAFALTDISSVTIPTGISEIKYGTFYGCGNLSAVNFNSALNTIGEYAFAETKLNNVEISDNVAEIKNYAFYGCLNLKNINLGNNLKSIGEKAFYGCKSLTEVDLPKTLTKIGDDAFTNCDSITTFLARKGNSVFNVSDGVLYNKNQTVLIQFPAGASILSYEIPSSVYKIESAAFNLCKSINELLAVDSAQNLFAEDGILYNYTQSELIKVPIGKASSNFTIEENVTSIADYAFEGSSVTGVINFPMSLKKIGKYVFDNCKNISAYNVPDSNSNFKSDNGVLYNYDKTVLIKYPSNSDNKKFTIPSSVVEIREGAFKDTNITEVTFNGKLEKIGERAFEGTALSEVTLPESIKEIGEYAFAGTDIESISIPKSVETVENYAFKDCSALKTVSFNSKNPPNNFGANVFMNCDSVKNINTPENSNSEYFELLIEVIMNN